MKKLELELWEILRKMFDWFRKWIKIWKLVTVKKSKHMKGAWRYKKDGITKEYL